AAERLSLSLVSAKKAKTRAAALRPLPYAPNRSKVAKALEMLKTSLPVFDVIWLASGLDYGRGKDFAARLRKLAANLSVYHDAPEWNLLALTPPFPQSSKLRIRILRSTGARARTGVIRALADDGRYLGDTPFLIPAGEPGTETEIALPLQLRNAISRLFIMNERTAAGIVLLDERSRRKAVGLVTDNKQTDQPLLAPLYYVQRALAPTSEITGKSDIAELAAQDNAVIILADTGRLPATAYGPIVKWINRGGMLIRFAGPHLAASADDLTPVRLRPGGRALGGALSWDTPKHLGAFSKSGPFAGLKPPAEVTVTRQVLAEPSLELDSRTWARLEDGTPLVTAQRRGKGWIILFHTTANASWSNLPLSGLFVDMLHRLLALAPGLSAQASENDAAQNASAIRTLLAPSQTLNGFGELAKPPPDTRPLPLRDLARAVPGPRRPPGFYGPPAHLRAFNLLRKDTVLTALGPVPGAKIRSYIAPGQEDISKWFLLAAMILFLLDGLILLILTGHLGRNRGLAMLPLLLVLAALALPAKAQTQTNDERAIVATRSTHLAFIRTGNESLDRISRAALSSLSAVLTRRTAFEPGPPMGVDPERDELVFFPFIYWPISASTPPPGPAALARIDAYMKAGGTVLMDTRDQQRALPGLYGGASGPNSEALRNILEKLDIPPLMQVPPGHVLTKSFYLMHEFPGRWQGGALWTDRSARDRVSGILIGSNDYAGAWARDNQGNWLFPVTPGGMAQREAALRAGVNIVLYALTGNYKADQVHVPAILERLGQ
ncbi:MAG TPA: DUF4159 domain-containing protein, partial [Rhizobiales bacterium]|nr:DUF4159 domain-containing protein [Hyphomicrobiales bacterium]